MFESITSTSTAFTLAKEDKLVILHYTFFLCNTNHFKDSIQPTPALGFLFIV